MTQSEGMDKHVRIYVRVFVALAVGTIVTVALAHFHWGVVIGIAVALLVATVKGSLVAGYFMHLASERKLIYFVLGLTAVFALSMLILLLVSFGDQQGRGPGVFQVPVRHVEPHAGHGSAEGVHVP